MTLAVEARIPADANVGGDAKRGNLGDAEPVGGDGDHDLVALTALTALSLELEVEEGLHVLGPELDVRLLDLEPLDLGIQLHPDLAARAAVRAVELEVVVARPKRDDVLVVEVRVERDGGSLLPRNAFLELHVTVEVASVDDGLVHVGKCLDDEVTIGDDGLNVIDLLDRHVGDKLLVVVLDTRNAEGRLSFVGAAVRVVDEHDDVVLGRVVDPVPALLGLVVRARLLEVEGHGRGRAVHLLEGGAEIGHVDDLDLVLLVPVCCEFSFCDIVIYCRCQQLVQYPYLIDLIDQPWRSHHRSN